jgi:hypothetical protein
MNTIAKTFFFLGLLLSTCTFAQAQNAGTKILNASSHKTKPRFFKCISENTGFGGYMVLIRANRMSIKRVNGNHPNSPTYAEGPYFRSIWDDGTVVFSLPAETPLGNDKIKLFYSEVEGYQFCFAALCAPCTGKRYFEGK